MVIRGRHRSHEKVLVSCLRISRPGDTMRVSVGASLRAGRCFTCPKRPKAARCFQCDCARRPSSNGVVSTVNRPVVLIGDVHGHVKKLESLWGRLEVELGAERFNNSRVVFLGDFCDRGPDTSGVLSFLAAIPEKHPGVELRLLAGNHDLGLMTFLNLIEIEGGDAPLGFVARRPEPPLCHDVNAGERAEGKEIGMHLQGRRWGAPPLGSTKGVTAKTHVTNAFESEATFASYGVEPGDRVGLLAAMPDAHKKLLASLEFVVEMDDVTDDHHPEVKKLIAVHAGLLSAPVNEQVEKLQKRIVNEQWIEALQGRGNVVNLPHTLASDVLVASGHHGKLVMEGRRLIVDSCAGHSERQLAAVILPERKIVMSEC